MPNNKTKQRIYMTKFYENINFKFLFNEIIRSKTNVFKAIKYNGVRASSILLFFILKT